MGALRVHQSSRLEVLFSIGVFDSGAGSRTYGGLGKEKGSGVCLVLGGRSMAWRSVDTRDEMSVLVWPKAWGKFWGFLRHCFWGGFMLVGVNRVGVSCGRTRRIYVRYVG